MIKIMTAKVYQKRLAQARHEGMVLGYKQAKMYAEINRRNRSFCGVREENLPKS